MGRAGRSVIMCPVFCIYMCFKLILGGEKDLCMFLGSRDGNIGRPGRTVWWIAKKFGTGIHGTQRKNPSDIGDHLTLPPVPSVCQSFDFSHIKIISTQQTPLSSSDEIS